MISGSKNLSAIHVVHHGRHPLFSSICPAVLAQTAVSRPRCNSQLCKPCIWAQQWHLGSGPKCRCGSLCQTEVPGFAWARELVLAQCHCQGDLRSTIWQDKGEGKIMATSKATIQLVITLKIWYGPIGMVKALHWVNFKHLQDDWTILVLDTLHTQCNVLSDHLIHTS